MQHECNASVPCSVPAVHPCVEDFVGGRALLRFLFQRRSFLGGLCFKLTSTGKNPSYRIYGVLPKRPESVLSSARENSRPLCTYEILYSSAMQHVCTNYIPGTSFRQPLTPTPSPQNLANVMYVRTKRGVPRRNDPVGGGRHQPAGGERSVHQRDPPGRFRLLWHFPPDEAHRYRRERPEVLVVSEVERAHVPAPRGDCTFIPTHRLHCPNT